MFTTLVLLLSCIYQLKVQAFPDGAGGCIGGMPAVGGSHLTAASVINGPLTMFNMTVDIDGVILDPTQEFTIVPGEDHTLRVLAPQQNLRGVLMRLQAPDGVDTSIALVPDQRTKIADVCIAPVVGVTHMKDNDKTDVSGILRFDEDVAEIFIDITTVTRNSDTSSEYAYNRYTGRVAASGTTAPSPIASPVAPPVLTSTAPSLTSGAPVAAPVVVPTPTPAPVAAPVAPASPTTNVPSSFPSVSATSSAPTAVIAPTVAPTTEGPSSPPSVSTTTAAPSAASATPTTNVPTNSPTTLSPVVQVTSAPSPTTLSFSPSDQPSNQPSDRPSDVPSAVPSLAPSITMSPTGAYVYCQAERTLLEACFNVYLSDSQGSCDNCVANAIPESVRSCNELNRILCAAITTDCTCDQCEKLVINYLDCAFRVTIACDISCS